MFCIGQYIMYSNSGICRVEAIGTPNFIENSHRQYYTLRPSYTTSDAKICVPVDTRAFMRKVISREEALGYLGHLRLFKKVCQKEKLVKKSRKKLGQIDLHYYRLAERMLSDELSVVFQETQDCSKKRLYDAAVGE